MLRVSLIRTLAGWQAIFGREILCTKSTKDLAKKYAKMEMGAKGFPVSRLNFV